MVESGLLQLAALGIGFVVLLLGGVYFLATREVFSSGEENADTAGQRAEDAELRERGDFQIPLRSRLQSISAPGKAVLLTGGLLGLFVCYLIYRMMQTGSPAEEMLSLKVVIGVVALSGAIGGSRLQRWADSRIGAMYNVYEQADGEPVVEKIEYFRHEMRSVGQETVIQQLHPQRLLGIFRRRMLIGAHRELRSSPKPLTDVVSHGVPEGQHAFEVEDGVIINHTRGEPRYNSSPEAPADVNYRSPNNLSYERAVGIQQSKERMRIERDAWITTSAAKDVELERVSEMIINREWQDKEDLMGIIRDYEEMKREQSPRTVDNRQSGISRSTGADGSSVLQEEQAQQNGHDASGAEGGA